MNNSLAQFPALNESLFEEGGVLKPLKVEFNSSFANLTVARDALIKAKVSRSDFDRIWANFVVSCEGSRGIN